jgi:hypothetical protein
MGYQGKILAGEIGQAGYYLVRPVAPLNRLEYSHVDGLTNDLSNILKEMDASGLEVCLNFEEIGAIDLKAIKPLIFFMKKYKHGKAHLVASPHVRTHIKMWGFDTFFNLYDSYSAFEEYAASRPRT